MAAINQVISDDNTESLDFIIDSIRNYFSIPWYDINDPNINDLLKKFVSKNNDAGQKNQKQRSALLVYTIDANNVGNRMQSIEPKFELISLDELKKWRKSKSNVLPNQSILFIKFNDFDAVDQIDGKNNNNNENSTLVNIRLVTDNEAIQLLSDLLKLCPLSTKEITHAYEQLSRFIDRETVLQKLIEERTLFLKKLNDWSESLLEYSNDNDNNDFNDKDLSESQDEDDDVNQEIRHIEQELDRLAMKIIVLKKRQLLLMDIVANIPLLFRDVPDLNTYRTNLTETSKMLDTECNQLFHKWTSAVSKNIKYDLTKPCVIIDERTQIPQITFSSKLEKLARNTRQLRELKFEIPSDIEQMEKHVSMYIGFVRDLRGIVRFYLTVADQILLCQRPMLIEKAKAFTNLLKTQQKITWLDDKTTIGNWINELKKFMENFQNENSRLRRLHTRILETIKWMIDVPLSQWESLIDKVKLIMNDVDRNQNYQNTYAWKKHWDYQLYKILEYHFNQMMITPSDSSRVKTSNRESSQISKRKQSLDLQIPIKGLSQWERMISATNSNTDFNLIELQFNQSGLVTYEPSFEILKQTLFEHFQQFIKFPSKFRAFVDWSLDAQLNPSDLLKAGGATKTLFHNIYYRNSKKFLLLYYKVIDAIDELIEIRQQFIEWTSMYILIKSMKSIGYFDNGSSDVDQSKINYESETDSADRNHKQQKFMCQTLEDYRYNLRLIKDSSTKFNNDYSMINEIRCKRSHLVINIIPIKMFIEWLLNEAETVLLRTLHDQCLIEINQIEQSCRKNIDNMKRKPLNITELIEYDQLANEKIEAIYSKIMIENVKIQEKIHFLKSWSSNSILNNSELDSSFDRNRSIWNEFVNIYQNRQTLLENHRESLQSKISIELESINKEIDSFLKRWTGLADNIKQTPEVINDFQINCQQIMGKVRDLTKGCEYFDIETPKTFNTIEKVNDEIQELYGKFHVLYEFEQGLQLYQEMEWLVCRNKLKKINQYINDWIETHQSDDEYLKSYIERWQQFLSIVEICRGDSYQQHHWNQFMHTILEINEKNFENLKLIDLWLKQDKLMECRQEILEINKRAYNDNLLREALNDLNQFSYNGKFILYPYQTKDNKQIMLIKEWHQCYNQISDCFLLLQTIKNMDTTEISDEYLQSYKEWETKLTKFESLIVLLNSVQRKWISLEPIYHSIDQIGSSAGHGFFNDSTFVRFSNDFQDIMRSVQQNDGKFAFLLNTNNLENRLKLIDQNFTATQKKLRSFIEESRQRFPRFYFLADEDLLLILSGKVDLNQSALVKKLFVNTIGCLIYSKNNNNSNIEIIEAIESIQGEIIPLKQSIQTDNTNGPSRIEQWLQDLDSQIKLTLKQIFSENLSKKRLIYSNHELFASLPSQILSLYCYLDFTERIEDAIQKDTLTNLRDEYDKILSTMTKDGDSFKNSVYSAYSSNLILAQYQKNNTDNDKEIIKKKIENLCEIKIKQVVLDLIHFIDVIKLLLFTDVHDQNHWCWQSQLRFYFQSSTSNQKQYQQKQSTMDDVRIRMGLASFNYSFEYLGCLGDSKLVYTPLTNKCFLTLTQAMDLGLGGNPYGPAGTGKTESVKALGQYFGRQVLVFNCDEAIDVKSMTRILVGLIKCGNWGCFDEFNRLQLDVLSVLSSQIQAIQNAIKNRSKFVDLEEFGQVAINNNSAIFITLNPAGKDYRGRNRIPDNLKSLFLPVTMTVPDNKTIVQFLSLAEGFSDMATKILGEKIPCWFDFAKGSMSQQKHYDWGLRTIKACLESSGRKLNFVRKKESSINVESEINLVVDTLRQQIKSKLVDSDALKFDGLIEAVFNLNDHKNETDRENNIKSTENEDKFIDTIEKVFSENSLLTNEYQTEKILQLYEQIQTRFGVVLIGPSGSGKTTIWQMLRKTLEQMSGMMNNNINVGSATKQSVFNVVVINPKSIPRSKLFGYIDEDTREWHDGLFSFKAREISRDNGLTSSMHWIVFDGDIDPDWVEALNSVLDDNRVLTLPSGERIDFDWNKCRILFETTSLKNASPATISRLGVVSIDMIMINEMIQCYVARNQLSFTSITTIQNYLDSNHQQLYLPISSARTLLEHLKYCQSNHEDDYRAIERISGQLTTSKSSSSSLEMINNLVVTESVKRYVEILKPLIGKHLCLIGPIGSGKCTLAMELLFTAYDGQLLIIDCTPTSDVLTFLNILFNSTTLINNGSQKMIRSQTGQPLWLFIKHFELLTYDKWSSNSLVSLLLLILKHNGFYHPDTFEWITIDSTFQMVFTCANLSLMDKRLLTELHLIQLNHYSLDEIEQILQIKTKQINNDIGNHFPKRYMDLVQQLVNDREQSSNQIDKDVDDENNPNEEKEFSNLNFLKIGIQILNSLKYHDNYDEQIVDYEVNRSLKNTLNSEQLQSTMNNNIDEQNSYYVSLDGIRKYRQLNLEQFEQQIEKWIKSYCQENDIHHPSRPLFPQTIDLAADLCSFLSHSSNTIHTDNDNDIPIIMIVGPHGSGKKFLTKTIAHNFGYERIWSPDYIISERHLKNELGSLFTAAAAADDVGGKNTKSNDQQRTSSNVFKKILLLIDEIHFEILPYLRDQIYTQVNQFDISSSDLIIRLVLTTTKIKSLDHLIWLRKAQTHRSIAFNEQNYQKLTIELIKNQIKQDKLENIDTKLFYPIFKHFQNESFDKSIINNNNNIRLYVDFIQIFVQLYLEQSEKSEMENEKMRQGVMKLDQVSKQVKSLKEEALEQKRLLDAKRQEADDAFNLIMNSMHQSEDKKVELEEVQKNIKIETDNLKERKAQIDEELNQIEPILQAAKAAIGGISANALSEIRSLRAPPEVIRDILEGVLRLMGVNDTSWVSMKTFLSRRGVKDEIMNFDCRKITPEIRIKVEQLLKKHSESFQTSTAKRASAAAAPLAEWVKANVEYSRVLHKIEPLEIELKKLESNLHRAQSRIKTLDNQLQDVDTEVDVLRERMQSVTVEAAQIEINLKKSTQILERSESIVNDLSDEHKRWNEQLKFIERENEKMPYKCIITAAYLTLACQQSSYSKRIETLEECFNKYKIEQFNLNDYLEFESEEEMLLFGSKASKNVNKIEQNLCPMMVSLICDPTHKALSYFKNVEITRLTAKDWLKVLELGIRFGRTVIITDFNQFDVRLVPLILGTIYGSSDTRYCTFIGDKKIDYNPKFSLYIMTDSLNSISPLTLSLIKIVNLSPNFGSISTQLLAHIINVKKPELETEKIKIDTRVRQLQKQLKELETELLDNLSNIDSSNILDNVPLIEKLKFLKKSAAQVQNSLKESDKLKMDLENERMLYKDLSQFAADLYFSMENLPKLCPMYYFGYREYEQLFILALKQKPNQSTFTQEDLSSAFYRYVSRALFSEHRRTFRQFLKTRYPEQTGILLASIEDQTQPQGVAEFFEEIFDDDYRSNFGKYFLIVTTPGSDPTTEIRSAITRLGYYELQIISMGNDALPQVTSMLNSLCTRQQSQQPIKSGKSVNQNVLCLNNLHLVINWLPQLIQLLSSSNNISSDNNYQQQNKNQKSNVFIPLILVTESCEDFPIGLLEMCVKFAYESPPGLRANLRRLRTQNISGKFLTVADETTIITKNKSGQISTINNNDISDYIGKLRLSLEYLHAVCCERRFYLPFGWTQNYEFSFNEFHFGCHIIDKIITLDPKLMRNSNKVYQYLDGLFHQVIYGGKINFLEDENILKLLLKRFFHPNSDFVSKQRQHQELSSTNNATNSVIEDLKMLGLPLNANDFRDKILEKRLKQNLQLLSSSLVVNNNNNNNNKIDDGNLSSNNDSKARTLTLNPSGIVYFRKLWIRLLAKCKIDQIDELKQELTTNNNSSVENNFMESTTLNSFIEQFQLFELDFAKRLILQIDYELHIQPSIIDIEKNLKINQTPDSWLNVWLNGVEIAQDFLINLARIYMKLSKSADQFNQSFDLTHCFHPKLFLNSLKQFAAKKLSTSIDCLNIEFDWNKDIEKSSVTSDYNRINIKLNGIWLEGALYKDNQLVECLPNSSFANPMPSISITFSVKSMNLLKNIDDDNNNPKTQSASSSKGYRKKSIVSIALYSCSKRQTLLEHWPLECPIDSEDKWHEMGVAMILGNFT